MNKEEIKKDVFNSVKATEYVPIQTPELIELNSKFMWKGGFIWDEVGHGMSNPRELDKLYEAYSLIKRLDELCITLEIK